MPVVVLLQIQKHGMKPLIFGQRFVESQKKVQQLPVPLLNDLRPGDDGLGLPIQLCVQVPEHTVDRPQVFSGREIQIR